MTAIEDIPFVESIVHPSDFSTESERAFEHALALALLRKTSFTILNAGGHKTAWTKFPAVRTTLERWGLLKKGSPRTAVFDELGARVRKVSIHKGQPLDAILRFLDEHPTDLIVLATAAREGVPRWIRPSMAEQVARKSDTMTLFVPRSARGFVSPDDGSISLRRILIPIDHKPSPNAAITYCTRAAKALGTDSVKISFLYVGDEGNAPKPALQESPAWSVEMLVGSGDVVEAITKTATEQEIDLIAMATEGRHGFLDALRGSVTEQVVRQSPCPVLAIPSD